MGSEKTYQESRIDKQYDEELQGHEEDPRYTQSNTQKYHIEKLLAMMAFIDPGLKYLLPSTTDWLSKWIDADKWMNKGKPTLIKKDLQKRNRPNNYRIISCRLAQIREAVYDL